MLLECSNNFENMHVTMIHIKDYGTNDRAQEEIKQLATKKKIFSPFKNRCREDERNAI